MNNKEFIESITLEGEIWCDVIGYEGLYMVSSFGRIASLSRNVKNRYGIKSTKQRILKPTIRKLKESYSLYTVSLWKNNIKKTVTVATIVAKSFLPNTNSSFEIDHLDGNPLNNNVENLKWCSHTENVNNPITRKRNSLSKIGKFNTSKSIPVVKLKDNILVKVYPSMAEAQREGYSQSKISLCCNGFINHYKGFIWKTLSDYEIITNMSKNALSKTNT